MGPITDEHKLTFKQNIQLAVQQKTSKFEMGFTYMSGLSGRLQQFVDLVDATTALIDIGRKPDTPDIDNNTEGVWVAPRQLAWGKLMEFEDTIKAVMNHQSSFIQSGAKSMIRGKDKVLSGSIFGTRKIGKDGGTTSAWAGQTVGVGIGNTDDTTAIGMNVKKILRARRLLSTDQVELSEEELFLSLNSQGVEELFRDLTFISADYRDRKVLDQPERVGILNVTILPPNDGDATFTDYDGSTFTAALWCKSGMHWGEFDPLSSNIPLRADKMMRPHPQMEQWLGASRSEDKKIVKILNRR